MTTTETIRDILRRISGDIWYVQVVADTVEISLTEQRRCDGCGQTVHVVGPVLWLDRDGYAQGAHIHQHGCGSWNTPHHAVRYHVDLDDQDALDELVEGMVSEVAAERAERIEAERAAGVDRLRAELAEAIESGEPSGDEQRPGAWLNGGRWEAWDYDPALEEGEVVIVRADEA